VFLDYDCSGVVMSAQCRPCAETPISRRLAGARSGIENLSDVLLPRPSPIDR
jgi:hypothetical protein